MGSIVIRRSQARTGNASFSPSPEAGDALVRLRKVLVIEALQALSAAHREVLNETILRDRTVNEAAEVLGIPVSTVKSRVYHALKALRVALAKRGVSP
jgi:RNA polymerase sigma-70 factor (ECF subfamily)